MPDTIAPRLVTAFNTPLLSMQLGWFRPAPAVPRSTLTCPVSPVATPDIDTAFEEAAPSSRRHFLPHWTVDLQRVGANSQWWVSLDPVPNRDAWQLTARLVPVSDAASDPRLSAADASLLPSLPPPAVTLSYTLPGSATRISHALDVVSDAPPGFRVTLAIPSRGLLAELTQALFTAELDCKLQISETLQVALPVAAPAGGGTGIKPGPFIPMLPSLKNILLVNHAPEQPQPQRQAQLSAALVSPRVLTVSQPAAAHPAVAPSSTAALAHPSIATPAVVAPVTTPVVSPIHFISHIPIDHVLINNIPVDHIPVDHNPNNPNNPAGEPLFRPTTLSIEYVRPFVFDRALDEPHILKNVVEPAVSGQSLTPWTLQYGDLNSSYFQPTATPSTFFYLPDSFKVCRRTRPPFYPNMSLTASGDSIDNLMLTLAYAAVPVIDPRRVADARAQLASKGVTDDGQLLATASVKLHLLLPGAPAAGDDGGARKVTPDLARGFTDVITLPVDQLTMLFDSFLSDTAPYFQGQVTAHAADNLDVSIPLIARADDLVAFDLFTRQRALDSASGGIALTLTNATEASIVVPAALPVQLLDGSGTPVHGHLVSASLPLPCTLAPAGADGTGAGVLTLVVAPDDPSVHAADGWDVALDLTVLRTQTDRDGLWNAIVDQTVVAKLDRVIHVHVPSGAFKATADGHYLSAIDVQFESGKSVLLTLPSGDAGALISADVKLQVPIADYILRAAVAPTYRYKRKLIYFDGSEVVDSNWSSDTGDDLLVSVAPTPVT